MKPILFSTPMVQAILEGRKTQTRRIIKNPQDTDKVIWAYKPGDILYVRETWALGCDGQTFLYRADGFELPTGWKPSIHMPAAAARIFLKVTAVKAERLQDISEADAYDEGVKESIFGLYTDYLSKNDNGCNTAKESFQSLWKSINGHELWDANPWVFAYTFERTEKPASSN